MEIFAVEAFGLTVPWEYALVSAGLIVVGAWHVLDAVKDRWAATGREREARTRLYDALAQKHDRHRDDDRDRRST